MARSSITPYGRSWEWAHSLWIGWAPFTVGILSWVSFLYAGIRARQRSWIIWAGAYFLLVLPALIFESDPTVGLVVIVWFVSSIHAFTIRAEYLRRLADARIERRGQPTSQGVTGTSSAPPAGWYPDPSGGAGQRWWDGSSWTGQTHGELPSASVNSHSPATASGATSSPSNSEAVHEEVASQPLDVNTAREEDLAALPGIGVILAKRIVSERNQGGGFRSIEAMAATVGLKPHILRQVGHRLTVSPGAATSGERPRGRIVDF